jgi:hypothetical protein
MPDKRLDKPSMYVEESDADIVKTLHNNPLGEHAVSMQAEMTSRLRRSLVALIDSSDRSAKALIVLTGVLVVLTGALVWLTWLLAHHPGG